jgi:diphosphomevalonate decarboxylase
MDRVAVVQAILGERIHQIPQIPKARGAAFAPSNIALCKYWGKRDIVLNLPLTDSVSVSLDAYGARTEIDIDLDLQSDSVTFNDQPVLEHTVFYQRLVAFLDYFRTPRVPFFNVATQMNIPASAGLASSACGFAAVVLALDQLLGWDLDHKGLSILARLGSGSACRSLGSGFFYWDKGVRTDGMDSYARDLKIHWPDFCIQPMIINQKPKAISSREAMLRTVETSQLYASWPSQVARDMPEILKGLESRDIERVGTYAECNAMSLHALMHSAMPPVFYHTPQTIETMHQIWALRRAGYPIYFTQDAGPHLKVLFLKQHASVVSGLLT